MVDVVHRRSPLVLALLLLLTLGPHQAGGQRVAQGHSGGSFADLRSVISDVESEGGGEETPAASSEEAGGSSEEAGGGVESTNEEGAGEEGGEAGGEEGGEGGEEGEGGEGEEGEEGEEEEEFSASDVCVAYMLLGSVSFVLGLLYLVNWADDDIRRYSWKIISTTISIFLAVLLFQGFNDVLLLAVKGQTDRVVAICQTLHCLSYIVVLQFTIGYISGAICEKEIIDFDKEDWVINDPLRKDNGETIDENRVRNRAKTRSAFQDDFGMEVPVMKIKKTLEQRTRWMKCYARLLAHMAGFACINAGATFQQLPLFRPNPLLSLVPIVMVQLSIILVFKVFGIVRERLLRAHLQAGRKGRRAKMYHDEVFEAENDISSLSSSFLIVQSIRFCLCGALPDAEGEEKPRMHHSTNEIEELYGIGLAFAILAVVLVFGLSKLRSVRDGELLGNDSEMNNNNNNNNAPKEAEGPRFLVIALNATSMGFAWCILWSSRWLCFNAPQLNIESIMGRVVLALLLSGVSCVAVFGLDFVDDTLKNTSDAEEVAGQVIQMIINAMGILIGFSWEHSFEGGVEAIASQTSHPATVKFFMGITIAGVMTPMWRQHILTKEMALQKLKQDRAMADRKKSVASLMGGEDNKA